MANDRHCPDCAERLVIRTVQGVEVDYCTTCGGVWLDPGELKEFTGTTNRQRSKSSHGHGGSHSHGSGHTHGYDDDDDEYEDDGGDAGLLGFIGDALSGGDGDGGGGDGGWGGGDGGGGGE